MFFCAPMENVRKITLPSIPSHRGRESSRSDPNEIEVRLFQFSFCKSDFERLYSEGSSPSMGED
jgi:hypothetical protein